MSVDVVKNTVSPIQRDRRVDFFRGLALLIIYIDHIHPNYIASFTLQRFAFLDAADVFVFISGYVMGLVYTVELRRRGFRACLIKALRRCFLIYRWHLGLAAATFFVLYCFSIRGVYLDVPSLYGFLRAPYWTALSIATLAHAPSYLGILPLYVVLTLITPIAIYCIDRGDRIFLACSVMAYLAVQLVPTLTLHSFNPLAWQFIFVGGILVGNLQLHGHSWSVISGRRPVSLAAIVAILMACTSVAATSHRLPAFLHSHFWQSGLAYVFLFNNKTNLGPLRPMNLLVLLVLVHRWRATTRFWESRVVLAIARCGQNSLEVFGAGVLFSYVATLLLSEYPERISLQLYANLIGCAGLIGVAALSSRLKESRSMQRGKSAFQKMQRATRRLVWQSGLGQTNGH
jgi:hypothetical protein